MSGVDALAWRPYSSLAYVPGIMALRHDTRISHLVRYRPLRYDAGPICEPCWMGGRLVVPVGWESQHGIPCPHGGAS